jgi:hypothetical protein
MTPQLDNAQVDSVARLAALKGCEEWICDVSPCNAQQFRQYVYIAGQDLKLGHLGFAFQANEAVR